MRTSIVIITSDGLATPATLLGKQLAEAVATVGLLVLGGELLPGQHLVAAGARETLPVPRCILIADAAFVDHLVTDNTWIRRIDHLVTDNAWIRRIDHLVTAHGSGLITC